MDLRNREYLRFKADPISGGVVPRYQKLEQGFSMEIGEDLRRHSAP
jgi:hypothetical protein